MFLRVTQGIHLAFGNIGLEACTCFINDASSILLFLTVCIVIYLFKYLYCVVSMDLCVWNKVD